MKHDMTNTTGLCTSLFWVGPAEGRTMEDAMKPDMELVSEMRKRKIKVQDLLDAFDGVRKGVTPTNPAILEFLIWYSRRSYGNVG